MPREISNFYIQISRIFYNLQAASATVPPVFGRNTLCGSVSGCPGTGTAGAASPKVSYPLVLLGYRRKRRSFDFVQMAVLEPA